VYEEPKNILEIINNLPYLELKTYDLRKIMRARNMYKSYWKLLMIFSLNFQWGLL
jgi:hypothetical protein